MAKKPSPSSNGKSASQKSASDSVRQHPDRFFNRELSWLEFNARVLSEAENPEQPLFERLRFLSITDSNLKEFYMVRVAGLRGQVMAGIAEPSADGLSPAGQLKAIQARARTQMQRQSDIWRQLKLELATECIYLTGLKEATPEQVDWMQRYFMEEIFPVLTPLAVDPAHPFPFIPNLGFAMILELRRKSDKRGMVALLPIPDRLRRFVRLPNGDESLKAANEASSMHYVMLEDIIQRFLGTIFPDFEVLITGYFSIIRDSEVEVKDDAEDLVRSYESALKKRRRGNVIRLIVNRGLPSGLKEFLANRLDVPLEEVIERDNQLVLKDVAELITDHRPDLMYEPFNARFPERIRDFGGDCFAAIKSKDIIVHHPYESFDVVVRFLQQAARDPDVLSIKQTLYRTSDDSPIVKALIEAADAGKSVTALVELAARFDEEANIRWARDLERAGVHVVYGFVNLKTHTKMSLVVRREGGGLQSYVHYGTGNYHPDTATVYTDLSFFTCSRPLCRDAARLFNYLTGYAEPARMEQLVYSPKTMRAKLERLIEVEIGHVQAGRPGHIWAKLNALQDEGIVDALYRASQAGVQIDLVVRGICTLRPGIKGLSENIRVHSIVGRFLEHSRIVCFGNGHGLPSPEAHVFIASADWMPRNLNWRVEVMVPINNPTVHQQVLDQIMTVNLRDNTQAWALQSDGKYRRLKPGRKKPFSAQRYFMENPSLSGRGRAIKTEALPPRLKMLQDESV